MKLGFARNDITPGFPVPLAGYLQSRVSSGVHDRLFARALVFGDASVSGMALLQLDLLNLDRLCVEKICKGASALGLERLLVCCIHTHSGYGGIFNLEGIKRELEPLFGSPDPRLVDHTVSKSLEALREAKENGEETSVRINRGTIEGLGTNRHGPELPCDNSMLALEFLRKDGKKILLYNLSCHPTVMNAENLLLSADLPGALASRLEAVPGGYDLAVFANGSAGDMSTRFTRRESTFAECGRFAAIIEKTLGEMGRGAFLPLEQVRLEYHDIFLKCAPPPDTGSAGRQLESALQNHETLKKSGENAARLRKAASLVEGARINLDRARAAEAGTYQAPAELPVTTGILNINGETIVCVPLELFSTLALELKRRGNVSVFGYVNETLGYLADTAAYDALDYEALFSVFARGEGERYIEQVCLY